MANALKQSIFNWSGGKDSSLALLKVLEEKIYNIKYLLTSVNGHYNRVSMHGVRTELLEAQAQSVGIPLQKLLLPEAPSMDDYNSIVGAAMQEFKKEGIEYSIFGDIFLEDLKKYREKQLAKVDMQAVFPIWKRSTTELVHEFIDKGFKAIIVCVNDRKLDKSFAGREINQSFLNDLPSDVDPCGENGEYHSFVYDGPIFKKPIPIKVGEVVYRKYQTSSNKSDDCFDTDAATNYDTGFYYCDLLMG